MRSASEKRVAMRDLIGSGQTVAVPGAFDAMSARLVERAGFPAAYVGSYATSASRIGQADVGLVGMAEAVDHARSIAQSVDIPVLADGEGGGDAANLWRTVQGFEQAGIAGIHIEDHVFGKHTSLPPVLLDAETMASKVRAAVDARADPNFLIIARTDIPWATGDMEETVRRLNLYAEAGADLVMPAGVQASALRQVRERITGKILMTDKPGTSLAEEAAAGASIVLYYGFSLYAAYGAVSHALERFRETRDADAVSGTRELAPEFERFLDYSAFEARAALYAPKF